MIIDFIIVTSVNAFGLSSSRRVRACVHEKERDCQAVVVDRVPVFLRGRACLVRHLVSCLPKGPEWWRIWPSCSPCCQTEAALLYHHLYHLLYPLIRCQNLPSPLRTGASGYQTFILYFRRQSSDLFLSDLLMLAQQNTGNVWFVVLFVYSRFVEMRRF